MGIESVKAGWTKSSVTAPSETDEVTTGPTPPTTAQAVERPRHVSVAALDTQPKVDKPIKLIAPHELRLENPDGEIITVPATNYFLEPDGSHREVFKELADNAMKRQPEAQAALGARISRAHADAEMSFRVKDPETGAYDKAFEVPCHPNPVPFEKRHFDMLVASTGSVMRALRDMLRIIYSNPNACAEDLGLSGVPAEQTERVMETIRSTVYFEPQLVDEAMVDYPFLTVGGFDAAVGDLDAPEPIFFEFNLGTPSGLSNNVQLQEVLRELDPATYRTIRDRLPEDDTFEQLAHAVSSNAAAWTRRDDGISVVIGPGVWNGAHPDVASIAHYSGMPLVNPSDLYEDADGAIRLHTPNQEPHPVVTGIYGRLEESYFIQDSEAGYPIRDPHLADNEALSEQLGVELEPGIVYHWEYDSTGEEIIGVKKDADGKPELMPVFETIGTDPNRPDAPKGSFANAIKSRNLYYSGLGGRVVDDKRVFQVVSRFIAPDYTRDDDEPIARPPRTLDVSEYESFYSSDDLAKFVVKAPDRSGGDGVMLMCNLTEEKRRAVVEEVRADPSHFIVQELVSSAVMLSPEETPEGDLAYGSLMTDWRLFSMMDAEGEVRAGPNSLLLRVANSASASTNTSQGGGYGIGVILDEPGQGAARAPNDSLLPTPPKHSYLSVSKQQELEDWLDLFELVLTWSDPFTGSSLDRIGNATFLADKQRTAMELFGREFAHLMPFLRSYDKGEVTGPELHAALLKFRADLMAHKDFPVAGVGKIIHDRLSTYTPVDVEAAGTRPLASAEELEERLPIVAFENPVDTLAYQVGDKTFTSVETGVYEPSPDLKHAQDRLAEFGGEVRHVAQRDESSELTGEFAAPYFRVIDGRPIIAIDMGQPFAKSALAHQLAYVDVYADLYERNLRDGMQPTDAAVEAGVQILDAPNWARAERAGINAEIKSDQEDQSWLNGGCVFRPCRPKDPGYAERLNHAEVETLRSRLFKAKYLGMPADRQAVLDHVFRLIHTAEIGRSARLEHLQGRAEALGRSTKPEARHERMRVLAIIDSLKNRTMFEICFEPHVRQRFEDNGLLPQLHAVFEEASTGRVSVTPTGEPILFSAPDAVHTVRDSIDDAIERDNISNWARVVLVAATAATAVQGYHIVHGPTQSQTVEQLRVQMQEQVARSER